MASSDSAIEFVIMMATVITAVAACLAALWAKGIGDKQNEINTRLLALQDYVAVSVTPDPTNGVIKLLNVGKANLYLWGFDMPENNQRFDKPRLLSAGTNDSSYYWIPGPKVPDITKKYDFEFKLYLTDQFNDKWMSENGGEGEPAKIEQEGKLVDAYIIKVWSYKTYKFDWSL
jgi:hypothetical protein